MKFSITIDCYPDGKLDTRHQVSDRLPDKERLAFIRLYERIKKIVRESNVEQLKLTTP